MQFRNGPIFYSKEQLFSSRVAHHDCAIYEWSEEIKRKRLNRHDQFRKAHFVLISHQKTKTCDSVRNGHAPISYFV